MTILEELETTRTMPITFSGGPFPQTCTTGWSLRTCQHNTGVTLDEETLLFSPRAVPVTGRIGSVVAVSTHGNSQKFHAELREIIQTVYLTSLRGSVWSGLIKRVLPSQTLVERVAEITGSFHEVPSVSIVTSIFQMIDKAAKQGRFSEIDNLILNVSHLQVSHGIKLGIFRYTYSFKEKLRSWEQGVKDLRKELERAELPADKLLNGLL